MGEDDPDRAVWRDLMRCLLARDGARDAVAGTVESIAQITPETLYTCHRAFYAPSNMVLCAVCQDTPERVAAIAAEILPPEAEEGLEKCLKEHGEALAPGALTDSMVVPLLRSGVLRGGRLVVKDPSRVLLTPDTLDKLRTRQVRLETAEAARTLCVTINPVSAYGWKFDKDEFMARMKEAVDVPVINVKEELA